MRSLLLLISCLLLIAFIKDIITVLVVLCVLSFLFYGVIDEETWRKITKYFDSNPNPNSNSSSNLNVDIDVKKTN